MAFFAKVWRWASRLVIGFDRVFGRGLDTKPLTFTEVHGEWGAATQQSTGYSVESILSRVIASTRQVTAGHAVFERDSVCFQEADFPYPVVAALLYAASANQGRLNVVDFGGSLGSTYRQCKPLLRHISYLSWHVIEQPRFVEVGRDEFSTSELSFWTSVNALPKIQGPVFILLSSVLQYIEEPDQALEQLLQLDANHLFIDRSSMSDQPDRRLCVQHVPPSIYSASYPCWILSRPKLLEHIERAGFKKIAEILNVEGTYTTTLGNTFDFRGIFAERTTLNQCTRPDGGSSPSQ